MPLDPGAAFLLCFHCRPPPQGTAFLLCFHCLPFEDSSGVAPVRGRPPPLPNPRPPR